MNDLKNFIDVTQFCNLLVFVDCLQLRQP